MMHLRHRPVKNPTEWKAAQSRDEGGRGTR